MIVTISSDPEFETVLETVKGHLPSIQFIHKGTNIKIAIKYMYQYSKAEKEYAFDYYTTVDKFPILGVTDLKQVKRIGTL